MLAKNISLNEFMETHCKDKEYLEQGNLHKMFDSNSCNICIVSSNEYAPFAAVTLQSIIANASDKNNYDIVVFTDDMEYVNREKLYKMVIGINNISIRICNITYLIKNMKFFTWSHFTGQTYYRLLIPILLKEYTKVLYLDSDTVVNNDVAILYNEDISGYLFGAAYDTHVISFCSRTPALEQLEYNKNILNMEDPLNYFQLGVCLYNLEEIRKKYKEDYFINEAQRSKLRWLDQDLINKLCNKDIKKISNRWNVMIANNPGSLDEALLPDKLIKEYLDARNNPYIIHYIGKAIPCFTQTPDMYSYFWRYARETEYYEIILQKMYKSIIDDSMNQKKSVLKVGRLFFMSIINICLPKGSKLRIKVKNFIFKLKSWK